MRVHFIQLGVFRTHSRSAHSDRRETSDVVIVHLELGGPISLEQIAVRIVREGGTLVIATRSVEHPGCPPPGNAVRAKIILSGYLLRPANEGAWTELVLFSHIDFGGNIPSFVMNQLSASAPVQLLTNVNKIAVGNAAKLAAGGAA